MFNKEAGNEISSCLKGVRWISTIQSILRADIYRNIKPVLITEYSCRTTGGRARTVMSDGTCLVPALRLGQALDLQ